ncbi:hypothetical protein R4Z09_28130 [Niallia oryzisoli]|uniref:Uncharacterized protein n=1 Tax=Niallia oryzisoli TaxID=1737571 RepID=A0ABZ2CGD2_9BACI
MTEYKQALIKSVRKKLDSWPEDQEVVQHKELYRFLQSISETAVVIGLDRAGDMAQLLIEQLHEIDEREWTKESLRAFLNPLLSIFFFLLKNIQV